MSEHWLVKHGLAYWYDVEKETAVLTPKGLQALREWLLPYTIIEEEEKS
jgi:hypothetical protein